MQIIKIFNYMANTPQAIQFLLSVPVVLIALVFHEVSHGYAAYKLGDPTARSLGRLSLNPLKHLDPVGALCMLIFRFGWARPVPINSRYFKKPRRDMAITAFAGPLCNFILAFFSLLFYYIALWGCFQLAENVEISDFAAKFLAYLLIFLQLSHIMNLSLAIFNLIPVPPLDGSRVLYVFLPPKYYFGVMKYERYISFALLILLWAGLLDGPLSALVSLVSRGMEFVVNLIPFNL